MTCPASHHQSINVCLALSRSMRADVFFSPHTNSTESVKKVSVRSALRGHLCSCTSTTVRVSKIRPVSFLTDVNRSLRLADADAAFFSSSCCFLFYLDLSCLSVWHLTYYGMFLISFSSGLFGDYLRSPVAVEKKGRRIRRAELS